MGPGQQASQAQLPQAALRRRRVCRRLCPPDRYRARARVLRVVQSCKALPWALRLNANGTSAAVWGSTATAAVLLCAMSCASSDWQLCAWPQKACRALSQDLLEHLVLAPVSGHCATGGGVPTVPAGGLLKLYETTGSVRWLSWAQELQSTMDERFWNQHSGGSGLPRSKNCTVDAH